MDEQDRIVIRSVQHSGTHFLQKLLKENGFKDVIFVHFLGKWNDANPIICPIRNPLEVYQTWISRTRDDGVFLDSWREFNRFYLEKDDLYIVPVDTPNREFYLKQLGIRLGKKLETNWEKVNSDKRLPNIEIPGWVNKVFDLPIVADFYGSFNPNFNSNNSSNASGISLPGDNQA